MRKLPLIAITVYPLPGLARAVWVQVRADPDDPPAMPAWVPGLQFGQRIVSAIWMVPTALLWPIFLPPTIYWCITRGVFGES
jgi:hypothetical protein